MSRLYEDVPEWMRLSDMEAIDHYKYANPWIVYGISYETRYTKRVILSQVGSKGIVSTYDSIAHASAVTQIPRHRIEKAIIHGTEAGGFRWESLVIDQD